MMPLQKKTLKESEVSTEIDLESLLGKASENRDVQEVFFQAALDKMMKRLDQGRGIDGKLHAYSKAYKDSLEFKAFGKSNTVNMQLTGDMISSIGITDNSDSKIKIGFQGDENNVKAYAHITGFKGHPTLDGKVSPREFFGWTDKELKDIARQMRPSLNEERIISDEVVTSLLERLLTSGKKS